MALSLNDWAAWPGSFLRWNNPAANRVKLVIAAIIVFWIGLLRDPDASNARGFVRDHSIWLVLNLFVDVAPAFFLVRLFVKLRKPGSKEKFDSESVWSIAILLNLPILLFLCTVVMDFFGALFEQGFWRELAVLAILIYAQLRILSHLETRKFFISPRSMLRNDPGKPTLETDALEGLLSSLSACIYGLITFFLFHLLSESFLSDSSTLFWEDFASSAKERLEQPFGPRHPELSLFVLFLALFVITAILAIPRLASSVKSVRKATALLQTALLGLLSFSVATHEIDRLGRRRESRLIIKLQKELNVAKELELRVKELSVEQRVMLANTLTELKAADERESRVASIVVARIEASHSYADRSSPEDDVEEDPLVETTEVSARSSSPTKEIPFSELREERTKSEIRVEMATIALQDALSEGIGKIGEMMGPLGQVMVRTISDFLLEKSSSSLKAVCSRIVSVFSGRDRPFAGSSESVGSLINRTEREVRENSTVVDSPDREGGDKPDAHPMK